MNINSVIKIDSQRSKRNRCDKINSNTASSQTPNTFYNNKNIDIIDNEPDSLDWGNYESIYKHIISYINLMIIDLSKDKEKVCKYLRDIFYSIFKISQEIKNNNKIAEEKKDENIDINLNTKQNCSTNEGWNFLTGEQFINKNNNNLIEQLLNQETKNEKNIIEPVLTQRIDNSKNINILQVSPFKKKIDRLQRKFKLKEKQYKLDKLNYLFRINEQNNLINKLEKEIQVNNINNMTQRDLNKIKCYPDFSFIKDSYVKKINSINNNHKKLLEDSKDKEIPIINNIEHLSLTNNNKEKKKYNLKDIFSKNIFLLKNGKMNKTRIMRFASFSMIDTKRKVEKIKNYKL